MLQTVTMRRSTNSPNNILIFQLVTILFSLFLTISYSAPSFHRFTDGYIDVAIYYHPRRINSPTDTSTFQTVPLMSLTRGGLSHYNKKCTVTTTPPTGHTGGLVQLKISQQWAAIPPLLLLLSLLILILI